MRILVAEDNIINQEITVHLLRRAGFQVDAVINGLEAIAAFEKNHYDLILMDCQMPEMDGYETTRALRAKGSRTPIIALTANAHKEDQERCLAIGMSDYLTKPVNEQILLQAVERALTGATFSPVLDHGVLKRLGDLDEDGSQNLMARLIDLYLKTTPEGLAELRRLAETRDSRLKKQAHFLKSSHANLGANRIVEILQRIEESSFTEAELPSLLTKLSEEFELVQRELLQLLKTQGP